MMVSIITINYNDSVGLKRTLDSVRFQTNHDYEHIIIDGASTDGSIDIIREYQDSEENVIAVIEPDSGPFFAMNKGIDLAKGDYCIFMNSGDSFYDEYVLEKFLSEHRTKDIYTGVACEHLGDTLYQWNPPYGIDINLKFFYGGGAISHQSSFIRTSLMKEMKYDTKYRIAADWKFFLDALVIRKATYEHLPFFVSHYMDGGISRDAKKAYSERDKIFLELFTKKQMDDARRIQEWDNLKKQIDPLSKVGKIIVLFARVMQSFRK